MERLTEEQRQDRLLMLQDLVKCQAWQQMVAPELARRLDEIERRLRRDRQLSIEDVRYLQGQALVLDWLVERPADYLQEPWKQEKQ